MTISIKIVVRAAAPLLLLAGVALSTPAVATEAREAIKRCDANPNCSFNVRNDGSVFLIVKGGGAVDCPAKGACTALPAIKSTGNKPGTGTPGRVTGVLSSGTKVGGKLGPEAPGKVKTGLDVKRIDTPQAKDRQSSASTRTGGSKQH